MSDQKKIIEYQYLPAIGWFILGLTNAEIWLDESEHYVKRSLRNKAILGGLEGSTILSVPLKKGKHSGTPIGDIQISYDQDWRLRHIRTIQTVYGKSPYFIHYSDELINLIKGAEGFLLDLNRSIASRLIEIMDLDITLRKQKEFIHISDKSSSVARDTIQYNGSMSLVEVSILDAMKREERKNHLPFLPSPRNSVLDLLFYLGPETRLYLRKISNMLLS